MFANDIRSIKSWLLGITIALLSVYHNVVVDGDFVKWWPFFDSKVQNFSVVLFLYFIALLVITQAREILREGWRRWFLANRESVYGNAIILLSQGHAQINSKVGVNIDETEFKTILTNVCNLVKEVFDYKTKANCSVSIKVITSFDEHDSTVSLESKVQSIAWDSGSSGRFTPEYNRIDHIISKNTCYRWIITNFLSGNQKRKKLLHFVSNNLPNLEDYENSSFELFPDFTNQKISNGLNRERSWPLPYKSELVVPISPLHSMNVGDFELIGFICIGCDLCNGQVFDVKYDVPMIKGLADGLYFFTIQNL